MHTLASLSLHSHGDSDFYAALLQSRIPRTNDGLSAVCHLQLAETAIPGQECFLHDRIWEKYISRYLTQLAILRDTQVRKLLREVCHEVGEQT